MRGRRGGMERRDEREDEREYEREEGDGKEG